MLLEARLTLIRHNAEQIAQSHLFQEVTARYMEAHLHQFYQQDPSSATQSQR